MLGLGLANLAVEAGALHALPHCTQTACLSGRPWVRFFADVHVMPCMPCISCRVLASRQRSAKELELEEQLRFEAYRCARLCGCMWMYLPVQCKLVGG